MENNEKIEILNSIEVIHSEGGEELCVIVENNEENREKLLKIGYTEKNIEHSIFEDGIDLTMYAFEHGAIYYTGTKFISSEKELFVDLKEAVDHYWNCVNSSPLEVGLAGKNIIALASQYVDVVENLEEDKK
ncbi:hypothetical protein D3C71_1696470 [compost metagenome]